MTDFDASVNLEDEILKSLTNIGTSTTELRKKLRRKGLKFKKYDLNKKLYQMKHQNNILMTNESNMPYWRIKSSEIE